MRGHLLDTQILIWAAAAPEPLSSPVLSLIEQGGDVYVSAVSIWEIAVKQQIGKLRIDADLSASLASSGFRELPITWSHARQVSELPLLHRDPFDRMLAAQALAENLVLVTADRALARCPVRTLV